MKQLPKESSTHPPPMGVSSFTSQEAQSSRRRQSFPASLLEQATSLTQATLISFDNIFYSINTGLVNSMRRKGNRVMKPVRAKVTRLPVSVKKRGDCPVSSPSPMMTEDDPLPQLSSTDMDPQTPPSNEQQVTDASSPVKSQETTGETPQQLVTLVDESLKRIKALEERISALQSTVTSAASTPAKPLPPSLLRDLQRGVRSSPSRTSRITVDCGGSDVTQSPIVTRRSSPVHPASAFMKSLIAEMRTVQLRPVGGSRTNAAMKNL